MKYYFRFVLTLLFLFAIRISFLDAQGVILNELSNGATGVREYFELVVIGPACSTVDIRGWIIDDNNGDFSCTPTAAAAGCGIAQGHLRFSTTGPWSAVPTGTIILIYNSADRNPLIPVDDPTDANNDSIYILPQNNAGLEISSGTLIPAGGGTCPAPTGNPAYVPSTYASGGTWNVLGLANTGDAGQIRSPGGAYFHGIGYGSNVNMNGGPSGLMVSAVTGAAKCYYYNSGNPWAVANWSVGAAGVNETPGTFNNVANEAAIRALRCPSGALPMGLLQFDSWSEMNSVFMEWTTVQDDNADHFVVLRRHESENQFMTAGVLPASTEPANQMTYDFSDPLNKPGNWIYKLSLVDKSGNSVWTKTFTVALQSSVFIKVYPVPASDDITFDLFQDGDFNLKVVDAMGRFVLDKNYYSKANVETSYWPKGVYYYMIETTNGVKFSGKYSVEN